MKASEPVTSTQNQSKVAQTLQDETHDDIWECFDEIADQKHEVSSGEDEDTSTSEIDSTLADGSESINEQENENIITRKTSLKSKTLITKEIEKYVAEPLWPRSGDPMVWWANHSSEYKMMKCCVLKYLSAPPSSVASERLFSAASRVYTENRNRSSPKHAEELIRIMKNIVLVLGCKPMNPVSPLEEEQELEA